MQINPPSLILTIPAVMGRDGYTVRHLIDDIQFLNGDLINHRWNFDDLLEKIWDYLKLVRIYTKPKGQLPDYTSPVVLPYSRTTVEDFCMKIHKNLIKEFKYALVWGLSVKHNPQKVGKDHTLEDEDVIQIVKK